MKKVKLLLFILAFGTVLFHGKTASAAEKSVNIDIKEAYASCVFQFENEQKDVSTGFIESPNGKKIPFTFSADGKASVTELDLVKGVWVATFESNSSEEIGKVKTSLVVKKSKTTDAITNIKIGKDIIGLKIYFKDSELITEWQDQTCGAIKVEIMDLDTKEVLTKETVSKQRFEYKLAPTIKNISVSVVPSQSASIEGAALVYSYVVNYNPDALVEFPKKKSTNKDFIMVNVVFNENYGLYVEDNDVEVLNEKSRIPGSYQFKIPVVGDNLHKIKVYVVDQSGNMKSFKENIIKDTVAPILKLEKELDGTKTYEKKLLIKGTGKDFISFEIGNQDVKVKKDDTFEYEYELKLGENKIVLLMKDEAGNITKNEMTVELLKHQTKKITPLIILLIAFILGIVLFKIISSKRKRVIRSNNNHTPKEDLEKKESEESRNIELEESEDFKEEVEKIKKKRKIRKIPKSILSWVLIIITAIFLGKFVFMISKSPTPSMDPTIKVKDFCFSSRLSYVTKTPKRGDIVVFKSKEFNELFGKRVIGIGGDEIKFLDGYVYLNGKRLKESYLDDSVETNCNKTFTVPDNCYFMLGDNRENSLDSRFWKDPFISIKDIKAKVIWIIPMP